MIDDEYTETTPTEAAFEKAAEMELSFYTRTEIADAFREVADEMDRAQIG